MYSILAQGYSNESSNKKIIKKNSWLYQGCMNNNHGKAWQNVIRIAVIQWGKNKLFAIRSD